MTFVAARCFGEHIVVASDTMISRPGGAPRDVLPGRLKIVILNPQVTIAFAGLLDQSVDAIKEARFLLLAGRLLSDVEEVLRKATEKYAAYGGGLEFILASHVDGVALKRIWEGTISANLDQTCIGDRVLLAQLLEREAEVPIQIVPHRLDGENRFARAFMQLFDGIYVSGEVGGFAVIANCYPGGHYYCHHTAVIAWDKIVGGQAVTQQQLAERKSGMTQWAYSSNGSSLRGVAVAGCLIEDAGIGYIYSPLRADEPMEWRPSLAIVGSRQGVIQTAFQRAIELETAEVGGGIDVTSSPSVRHVPSVSELEQIKSYAANAMLPTRVQIVENGVELFCGTPDFWQMAVADLYAMYPDPVSVLKTAIDRINATVLDSLRRAGHLPPVG